MALKKVLRSWMSMMTALVCVLGLIDDDAQRTVAAEEKKMELQVYVGTYTGGSSQGIYLSRFNSTTGALAPAKLVAETDNPSFLAIHPSKRFLYAVNETGQFEGKETGAVSAFAINRKSGTLKLLNQQASQGTAP